MIKSNNESEKNKSNRWSEGNESNRQKEDERDNKDCVSPSKSHGTGNIKLCGDIHENDSGREMNESGSRRKTIRIIVTDGENGTKVIEGVMEIEATERAKGMKSTKNQRERNRQRGLR